MRSQRAFRDRFALRTVELHIAVSDAVEVQVAKSLRDLCKHLTPLIGGRRFRAQPPTRIAKLVESKLKVRCRDPALLLEDTLQLDDVRVGQIDQDANLLLEPLPFTRVPEDVALENTVCARVRSPAV